MANDTPVRIHLGGHLGKRFGAEWKLCVSSPAEAIRAIDVNTKGELKRFLTGPGAKRYYKIAIGKTSNLLDKEEASHPSGNSDIYILPTVKGAKAVGKILAGIALIALTVVTFGAGGPLAGGLWGISAATWSTVGIGLGASLALGGITQLLTPTPSFNQDSQGDSRGERSNVFEGNAAAVSQGGAVGLVYGRALVAPMPISLSYSNVEQSATNSFAPGQYEMVTGPGGVITYIPIQPGLGIPDYNGELYN